MSLDKRAFLFYKWLSNAIGGTVRFLTLFLLLAPAAMQPACATHKPARANALIPGRDFPVLSVKVYRKYKNRGWVETKVSQADLKKEIHLWGNTEWAEHPIIVIHKGRQGSRPAVYGRQTTIDLKLRQDEHSEIQVVPLTRYVRMERSMYDGRILTEDVRHVFIEPVR